MGVPLSIVKQSHADVVKLVYTPDLGSGALRRGGSSPLIRTTYKARLHGTQSLFTTVRGYQRGYLYAKNVILDVLLFYDMLIL